ncbi:plasmid mobilization protein [Empedobacter sp.]|uniref:plasmid mobilization protein n=1 Tax=Empedobacter sp. TaxID=1927715 RepID=UPI0028989904|nr:hypothetical protein [Empedobacter sp.]
MKKNKRITIRLSEEEKNKIIKLSEDEKLTMTDLIINKIMTDSSKKIFKLPLEEIEFINKNYSIIGDQINQIAKQVNTDKKINNNTLVELNEVLKKLIIIKRKSNAITQEVFKDIKDE